MKKSKYTEEQIAFALKQAETGTRVEEIRRKFGISQATFYIYGLLPICKRPAKERVDCVHLSGVSHIRGAPKWEIRAQTPQQLVGFQEPL